MERIELVEGFEEFSLTDVRKSQLTFRLVGLTCALAIIITSAWSGYHELPFLIVIPILATIWSVVRIGRLIFRNTFSALEFVRREEQAVTSAIAARPFEQSETEAAAIASKKFYRDNDSSKIIDRSFTVRFRHFWLGALLGVFAVGIWYCFGQLLKVAIN